MSGASTWLHGQRKTELVDLAEKVGLKDYESLKKADLETALDDHMRANQSKLSKDSSFAAFYKRINPSSPPSKKEVALVDMKETKAPKAARRATKAKEEIEADAAGASTSNAVMRTPGPKLSFPANVPLPPSPAVVATHIDRQAARVRSSLSEAYTQSGIAEYTDNLRDTVSTTASIESIAIIIELLGLRSELIPFKYLATLPASSTLGTSEIPLQVPDVFALLTANFWSVFSLWFVTSVMLPMTFAYFFNMTLKAKHGHVKNAKNVHPASQYDPLTFNIAKGLVMWLVYGQDAALFGWPDLATKVKIQASVPGGYQGVLVASGIGALTSLYEAILKK